MVQGGRYTITFLIERGKRERQVDGLLFTIRVGNFCDLLHHRGRRRVPTGAREGGRSAGGTHAEGEGGGKGKTRWAVFGKDAVEVFLYTYSALRETLIT